MHFFAIFFLFFDETCFRRNQELVNYKWHVLLPDIRNKSGILSGSGRRVEKNARHVSRLHEREIHIHSLRLFSYAEASVARVTVVMPGMVGGLNAARERDQGRCKDIRPPGTMSAINAAWRPFDVNQTVGEYAPLPHWPRLPFVAL